MKSLIIVESHNDKYFVEKLREVLDLENIELKEPICNITDYECLNGLSEQKLTKTFEDIKFDQYQKIGIIIDADNEGIENRIALINRCVRAVEDVPANFEIVEINKFIKIESLEVEIGCYITNKDGLGELETVLKEIASKDTTHADCLEAWKNCLKEKGKPEISQKDFDKFWVSNYLRFDTCLPSEKSQAGRKCNYEAGIKKDIWDFENQILDDLKEFLKLVS